MDKLTVSVANLTLISESSRHSNAKNHEDPIDIWNIYLSKELLRCMHDLNSRETA